MLRTLPLIALASLLALALPACQTGSGNANTPLIASSSSPIADVPIPAGFAMRGGSQSYVTPNGQLRFVNHHYKGSEDMLPVVRFYRDQLPNNGWNLVSQQQAGDAVVLNFTKGSEDLIVTVKEGTLHTHVNVRLHPAARPAATR